MTKATVLLAVAPEGQAFTDEDAQRLVGRPVHNAPGSVETSGKIVRAWLEADGSELRAELELTQFVADLVMSRSLEAVTGTVTVR